MELWITSIFLCASLLFYVLLGGADFGAGIVEMLMPKRHQSDTGKIIYRAIGPVWEANHMWLIICVVILFVGYPEAYLVLSVQLHFPVLMVLLGITLRGCAFVFRHYDVYRDDTHYWYNLFFKISCLMTPFFLGTILGSFLSGDLLADIEGASFEEVYIQPWLNPFSFSIGLLSVAVSAFLASVFLVGEAIYDVNKKRLQKLARILNLVVVVLGGNVILMAVLTEAPVLSSFWEHPWAGFIVVTSLIGQFVLHRVLKTDRYALMRVVAGVEVGLLVLGSLISQYPVLLFYQNGQRTFGELAAPSSTLVALAVALVGGVLLIFPMLFYMWKHFSKVREGKAGEYKSSDQ